MYHNIFSDPSAYRDLSPSATSYFVSSEAFEAQLKAIKNCGGACISWDAIEAFYRPGNTSNYPNSSNGFPVLLTFDDGWSGAFETGGPILVEHCAQALLFVTTDFINRPYMLSRAELSRIDPAIFHIGSHARTHRMLSLLNSREIRAELEDSRKLLEDIVGYKIESLSIPSGAVNARVRKIAAECGFRFVFDSEPRVNRRGSSSLAIGRVAITGDTSLTTFRNSVRQRLTRQRLRRAVLEGPKRVLGLRRYESMRRWLLRESPGQQVTHES